MSDEMLAHYEILIQQHSQALIENLRLERQLVVARHDVDDLRERLHQTDERLSEALGRLRSRIAQP